MSLVFVILGINDHLLEKHINLEPFYVVYLYNSKSWIKCWFQSWCRFRRRMLLNILFLQSSLFFCCLLNEYLWLYWQTYLTTKSTINPHLSVIIIYEIKCIFFVFTWIICFLCFLFKKYFYVFLVYCIKLIIAILIFL